MAVGNREACEGLRLLMWLWGTVRSVKVLVFLCGVVGVECDKMVERNASWTATEFIVTMVAI